MFLRIANSYSPCPTTALLSCVAFAMIDRALILVVFITMLDKSEMKTRDKSLLLVLSYMNKDGSDRKLYQQNLLFKACL